MSYIAWIESVTGIDGWQPIIERYNTLTFRNQDHPGYCIWATPGFNDSNMLPVSVTDEFGNELHSATFSMKGWDFNKFQEMIDRAIQITGKKIG